MDGFTLSRRRITQGITATDFRSYAAQGMAQARTDGRGNTTATVTDAQGNTSCYRYDARGHKLAEWGTGIQSPPEGSEGDWTNREASLHRRASRQWGICESTLSCSATMIPTAWSRSTNVTSTEAISKSPRSTSPVTTTRHSDSSPEKFNSLLNRTF